MREIRDFLLGLLLVGTIIYGPVFLYGCSSDSNSNESFETAAPEEKRDRKSEQAKAREKYAFDMIYFDWRGVYLVKLQGHEYLRAGDFIIHTASCPGEHTLVSP